ncbi:hypothetical protein ACOME3_005571 [Neoechinorhynchus agilis]
MDRIDDRIELDKLISMCTSLSNRSDHPAKISEKETAFFPSTVNDSDSDEEFGPPLPDDPEVDVADESGERLITGGSDCFVRIWDFNAIHDEDDAIRSLQPCGVHVIRDLSVSGDNILVISASAQARLISRDGRSVLECIKGDQYLVDMSKTKGHVSSLNAGSFHPFDQDQFLTCSDDGTARIWSVERARFEHHSIIKARNFKKGIRCGMASCGYSSNGNVVNCGTEDGSVYLWDRLKPFVSPAHKGCGVHCGPVVSLVSAYDDNLIMSRCLNQAQLWDVRSGFRSPLKSIPVSVRRKSDTCVSPDDRYFLIPSSEGNITLLDRSTLQTNSINLIETRTVEVNRVLFHPRLHQIVCGRSDGRVSVHYDEERSIKGARQGFKIAQKGRKGEKGFFANDPIINPLALPLFRQEKIRNLHLHRVREQISESRKRRPEIPISGAGEGGRIGHHGGTLSSYIVKNIALQHVSDTKEDPRAALLKYAEKAESDPFWVTPAYKKTQPNPIFANVGEDEDTKTKTNK